MNSLVICLQDENYSTTGHIEKHEVMGETFFLNSIPAVLRKCTWACCGHYKAYLVWASLTELKCGDYKTYLDWESFTELKIGKDNQMECEIYENTSCFSTQNHWSKFTSDLQNLELGKSN